MSQIENTNLTSGLAKRGGPGYSSMSLEVVLLAGAGQSSI